MDLRPIYFNALDQTGTIVAGVTPDQLSGATPCAEFDTRALINHIIGGTLLFVRGLEGEEVDPSAGGPDFTQDDAGAAFKDAAAAAQKAWNEPGALEKELAGHLKMDGKRALRIALMEAVIHGWDLAKATGQPYEIHPMVAQPMLDGLKQFVTDEQRKPGGPFGPEVTVPDDASAQDKLVAFLGRTP